jgi:hypothetical protein
MDAQVVRQLVRQLWERTAYTSREDHCFAPWYLNTRYQLSETQALQQSSDGSYDFGIDAFHLIEAGKAGSAPRLVLVQAKYSDSLPLATKGFRELERALPELVRSLSGIETGEPIQNKVVVNLRAALNRLPPEARGKLELEFQVVHLCSEDETIVHHRLRETVERLSEALTDVLHAHTSVIRHVSPRDLGPPQVVVAPPETIPLRLAGAHEYTAGAAGRMFLGIGRLADLIELYRARRDDLFSRNVRYYLTSKKNTEKGPAGKMRATLKQICVEGSLEPERFAMFHNGVTMHSRRASLLDGQVHLRDPYVLNGCQTIKNAFLFRHDPHLKGRVNEELWNRIAVPVRVIESSDDDLVRVVTVNNNRQNAMSPAALRANDPVQIRLEQHFKERRIVYQRQEGAVDNLWSTRPELLEDEYENSGDAWVDIQELARSIAGAAGEVSLALRPNDLFESDAAYARTFSEEGRLRSIVFLTFLQNLHDTLGLVLKKDLRLEPTAGGPATLPFAVPCDLSNVQVSRQGRRPRLRSNVGLSDVLARRRLPRRCAPTPELARFWHSKRASAAFHDAGVRRRIGTGARVREMQGRAQVEGWDRPVRYVCGPG